MEFKLKGHLRIPQNHSHQSDKQYNTKNQTIRTPPPQVSITFQSARDARRRNRTPADRQLTTVSSSFLQKYSSALPLPLPRSELWQSKVQRRRFQHNRLLTKEPPEEDDPEEFNASARNTTTSLAGEPLPHYGSQWHRRIERSHWQQFTIDVSLREYPTGLGLFPGVRFVSRSAATLGKDQRPPRLPDRADRQGLSGRSIRVHSEGRSSLGRQ